MRVWQACDAYKEFDVTRGQVDLGEYPARVLLATRSMVNVNWVMLGCQEHFISTWEPELVFRFYPRVFGNSPSDQFHANFVGGTILHNRIFETTHKKLGRLFTWCLWGMEVMVLFQKKFFRWCDVWFFVLLPGKLTYPLQKWWLVQKNFLLNQDLLDRIFSIRCFSGAFFTFNVSLFKQVTSSSTSTTSITGTTSTSSCLDTTKNAIWWWFQRFVLVKL